jgi:hypothetical protein
MGEHTHPFLAVAALAAKRDVQLEIKIENDGDYVRLYSDAPPLFFKHRDDPSDSFDRDYFDDSKRILLSEDDCAHGPDITLALIEQLLEKFADYQSQRT